MMHKYIDCPTCGNIIVAKSIHETQKCQWCKQLFKVTVTKRNANGKRGKFNWSVEPIDFNKEHDK